MSRWTHSICEDCWNEREPLEPVRLKPEIRQAESCCYCGQTHTSGIYIRDNWAFTRCRGETGIHKGE